MTGRNSILQSQVHRQARQIEYPKEPNGLPTRPSALFGSNVFGLKQLKEALPKPVYEEFLKQLEGKQVLQKAIADAIAHAAKIWALDKGATHFTHWFQPQTDSTAEKHDSFLNLNYSVDHGQLVTEALDSFSGSQLMQAEPDASSFPHGGVRTTFEARGYTVWDTTSPMFVQDGPHGTTVLYIPSVFISYNGEALDEKTVLKRSNEAISDASLKLLRLLGDTKSTHVHVTLGTEQEFFLIDREMYSLRPDLRMSGRTLLGNVPPKHQQLEDHYFGRIPSRVLAAISEAELELWKLGVPVKTRHNEVAPSQFEMAPIFEEASIAVDHNLLTMDVLHKVAHRHKLKVLFHEKPFKGVNGSGKHCNWSLSTDAGKNLLDPTANPEKNETFLLFLVAIMAGVQKHAGLLRAGISSASNEHRLGANEAPPGIISVFLGEHLTEVLNSIEEGRDLSSLSKPNFKSVKVGGTAIDLKVSSLPEVARDLTDRNRTSPFAFTGNKFEFRAVGSKQSPSFPVTLLNAAVAGAIQELVEILEQKKGSKPVPSRDDISSVLKLYITSTKPIRFEGDGYSEEWVKEAHRRGLPNLKTAPDAFQQLTEDSHQKLLSQKLDIFTASEIKSRYHVLLEKYSKDILIEAKTLILMVKEHVLPSVFKYRQSLASTASSLKSLGIEAPEESLLRLLSGYLSKLLSSLESLESNVSNVATTSDHVQQAKKASALVALLADVREKVDLLEQNVSSGDWPFPKYLELLF